MSTVVSTSAPVKSLEGPEVKQLLHQLRKTDNVTNWYYFLRTYVFFAVAIGAAVWLFEYVQREGLSFWWNVPIAFVGIVLVGAGQHQLSGLAHEASHRILFRNRRLN